MEQGGRGNKGDRGNRGKNSCPVKCDIGTISTGEYCKE